MYFAEIFSKNVAISATMNFSYLWHFSDLFLLFLTCKYKKQKIVEL